MTEEMAGRTGARVTGLFVGLTTVDVVHRAARRPGPDQKVTATRQDVAAGGPAAGAAVTFAALGGRALLLSALGAGPAGRLAAAELAGRGVEVLDVVAGEDYPVAVSAVLVEEGTGDRSVVSPDAALRPVTAPPWAARVTDGASVVLLDGHHPDLAAAVLAGLPARGGPGRPVVVLDGGRWKPALAGLLPAVDAAVLSADFRLPGPDRTGPGLAAAVLDAGPTAVVITAAGHPVRWWTTTASGACPVPAVTVRDTLGAGDAFHGAFAGAVARGWPVPRAVAAAVTVASHRVSRPGPREWLASVPVPWAAPA